MNPHWALLNERSRAHRYFIILVMSLFIPQVIAAPKDTTDSTGLLPMPSPLTLEFVLSNVSEEHPDVQSAQAQLDYQQALLHQVDAESGLDVAIKAEARYIEPPIIAPDQRNNDSRISLLVSKRLYDFGRSSASNDAALSEVQGSELKLLQARNQHRIDLMAAFFDVLLADLTYIRENEALATSYIRYDRLRMRRDLGQHSDIEVLEAEKDYQAVRVRLYRSRSMQQTTRNHLANMMNRPNELMAEIAEPKLDYLEHKIADVEQLHKAALENNPYLNSLRQQVLAAQNRLKAARAGNRPVLNGKLSVSDYNRDMGSYNDYEASLILDIPLWSGGSVQANVAKQLANLKSSQAKLRSAEMDIHQTILETWQRLDVLRIERQEAKSIIDFRDLYLDRSRALYEMEVKTDLGDSMVQVSDARLKQAEAKFKTALALARLNALLGKPVFPFDSNESRESRADDNAKENGKEQPNAE